MVLDPHASISQIVFKRLLEYFGELPCPLLISPSPTNEMRIYNHDCLPVYLEPEAYRTFVPGGSHGSTLDLAYLNAFRLKPSSQLSFQKYS